MHEERKAPGTGASPREVMARFGEEVLNGKNLDIVDEIASEDFVEHDPPFGQGAGREGLKRTLAGLFAAFPDQLWETEEVIYEGEKVVSRFTFHGTHDGEFMGMPPTGRKVAVKGVVIDRVVDGKWTESRILMDNLGMMQQLGAIPPPQQAAEV